MNILNTLRQAIKHTIDIGKTPKNYRWVNVILLAYVYLFVIYNVAWLWMWFALGKVVLSDLIALGTLMCSPAAMAALLMFLKIKTVDKGMNYPKRRASLGTFCRSYRPTRFKKPRSV